MHHRGSFTIDGNKYLGGKIFYFDYSDEDLMSLLELEDMAEQLGCSGKICVHYFDKNGVQFTTVYMNSDCEQYRQKLIKNEDEYETFFVKVGFPESTDRDEYDDDLAPDRAAAEVIDTMALNLSKHVFPTVLEFASLNHLMGKLFAALQNSPRSLQDSCMSAIGSVVSAAEQAFITYADRVLQLMKMFMFLTNDEYLCSCARATELVRIIVMSVGRTRMESVLPPFIEAAILFSELREYTYGFFNNIAEILDDGFTQVSLQGKQLMYRLLHRDPKNRLGSCEGANEIEKHPFFRGINWALIRCMDTNVNGFGEVSFNDEACDEPAVHNISIRTGCGGVRIFVQVGPRNLYLTE
ncbi:hypothetical protein LguiB_006759 [Lonicera macranthoides]